MLTWEIILVLLILGCALASFVWEKIPTDLTSMLVFAAILFVSSLPIESTFPDPQSLFLAFANPAPLAIGALFIISAALEKCGVIEQIASAMEGLTKLGYKGMLFVVILTVAIISAFINNTPVVVVFLPVMLSLSRKLGTPASKLLIPLSYASIFGGTCTLVGTSTNILASGIIESAGYSPISMFELSKVGVPLLLLASVYLVMFGHKLLPSRESLTAILTDEERKGYFTEAYIRQDSDLINQTVADSGIDKSRGLRVIEIIRNEVALKSDLRTTVLEQGDRLILACRPSGFVHARSVEGLRLAVEEREGLETISAHEGAIVEGVIAPRSSIAGRTIDDLNFRQRFRMIILAVHRRGINMRDKIEHLTLEEGDTILMMGTEPAREQIRRGNDIILLDRPPTPSKDMRKKAPIVLTVMLGIILSVSLNILPITTASFIGVTIILLTGTMKPKEGYAAIDWSILILIYGMLGFGSAMASTGTSEFLASPITHLNSLNLSPGMTNIILLASLYLITTILTEILSNNATIVLMTPIALQMAVTLGVDPRPLIIATCIASSASFSTPIGYQTNTYVYSVGGYKFSDFLKIGIPLNILYFIGTVVIVPFLWSF